MQIFNGICTKSGCTLLWKDTAEDKSLAGFTLLELLMATAILLLMTGVFLNTFMQYSSLIAIGRSEDIALSAAGARLEEIANSDLSNVTAWNGTNFPVQGLTAPTGQPNPGRVTAAQIGTTNLFDINVTISWQEKDRLITRTIRRTLVNR